MSSPASRPRNPETRPSAAGGRERPSVLLVIGSLDVGGAETHVSEVASRLAQRGWSVRIFCLSHIGTLGAALNQKGVSVCGRNEAARGKRSRSASRWRLAASLYRLVRLIRRTRPDIVHFFLPEAYLLGGLATLAVGPRLRIMSRRSLNYYQARRPWAAWIERRLHSRMSAIVGNSHKVVAQLRDDEGVDQRRLGLIYNGVDTERFAPSPLRSDIRASLGMGDHVLVFVVVANLIAYKGHRDLLEAFGFLGVQQVPEWRLLVVGRDDGIGSDLAALAKSLGIHASVSFLGPRRDVPELLAASDVGLLTSHEEGFSNAILEAMASGLPMVVTDAGGNAEAVENGKTGYVTPIRDPRALAEAIGRLASDDARRAQMGRAARARCLDLFSIDACVGRYEELYAGLYSGIAPGDISGLAAFGECQPSPRDSLS